MDICPETVRRARAKLGVDRISCADALALPFEAGSFEAVFMECVLSLIPQTEKAISEAARVIKKGGRFVISSLEGGEELCAQGRMGKEPLLAALRAKGFEIISLSDECPALRQFLAEIIFRFDSIENYRQEAQMELGGAVLDCPVPMKGTGYILITAIKK